MEYKDFYYASNNLKIFINEQDKLNTILKILSPSSGGFCDFGNKFIDDYISLLELALCDDSNWFSWFVFENEFGKNELEVKVNGINYKICNEKQFFEVFIKMKKEVLMFPVE